MLNMIVSFVEKQGGKGALLIFGAWLILFFLAVELRAGPARLLLPVAGFVALVYLSVWTWVLLRESEDGLSSEGAEGSATGEEVVGGGTKESDCNNPSKGS